MPQQSDGAWSEGADKNLSSFFARDERPERAEPPPAPPPPEAPKRDERPEPEEDRYFSDPVTDEEPEAAAPEAEPEAAAPEPAPDPGDRVARLEAELAELRQRTAAPPPEWQAVAERQRALEQKLAQQEADKLDHEIQVLEAARERITGDPDQFDLKQYDRIVRRQHELEMERVQLQARQQSQPQPVSEAQAREVRFVSEHRITQPEYQAMIAAEQFLVYKHPELRGVAPEERWKRVLAEVRGQKEASAPKPTTERPRPRGGAVLQGKSGTGSAGGDGVSVSADEEQVLRRLLGAKYYTPERARKIKGAK